MKLPDLNLLLYAYDTSSAHHLKSKTWLEEALSGDEPIGFAWSVLIGFVRLTTHPKVFAQPLTPFEAFAIIDLWLAQPVAVLLQPTQRHLAILRSFIATVGTAGNLTSDAHLAALAIEYGAEVCSADADLSRFPGLLWSNPLQN